VIRTKASPRHVPRILVVDIPRTMNGKVVELAVREIHRRDVVNVEALANPAALDQFRDRVELAE
jgi:acetoacetyl-CoA synthetase